MCRRDMSKKWSGWRSYWENWSIPHPPKYSNDWKIDFLEQRNCWWGWDKDWRDNFPNIRDLKAILQFLVGLKLLMTSLHSSVLFNCRRYTNHWQQFQFCIILSDDDVWHWLGKILSRNVYITQCFHYFTDKDIYPNKTIYNIMSLTYLFSSMFHFHWRCSVATIHVLGNIFLVPNDRIFWNL